MTFNTLGLSDTLLQAVQQTGYTAPTPIQQKAIPEILAGRDVMAAAQTGTGKTAGFTLPLLQLISGRPNRNRNSFRALILTPTRELAAQIEDSIQTYGAQENLRYGVVFGGVNINPQKKTLNRGLDILVATPGRLLDLYQQKCIDFRDIEVLILDEADRMLDMGFIRDIKKIMALLPKKRQNLLFSATFSDDIRVLAKTICNNPVEIDVAPRNSTVEAISQKMYYVDKASKPSLLIEMMLASNDQTLVFSRTKHGANNLAKKLNKENIKAAAIHGNKSQAQRTKALYDFKQGGVQVLVATDIAARGIDIDQLARVINFDLPHVPEDYVHRIGRTGRAGATGLAISLVSGEESKQLRDIERLIKFAVPRGDSEEYTFALANPAPASKSSEPGRRPSNNNRPRRRQGASGKPANKGSGNNKWRSSRPKAAA
tara:strand:+ start:30976 stop:32262 length:1287 start_codon:yes stop_codon:yes gene_type:complete